MTDKTKQITIKLRSGIEREVTIHQFPAMDGFAIKNGFMDYAVSKDDEVRRKYVCHVLAYAEVNGSRLNTPQAVDQFLETWPNLREVFEAVCAFNMVDTKMDFETKKYWNAVGSDIGAGLVTSLLSIVKPLLDSASQDEFAAKLEAVRAFAAVDAPKENE